MPERKYGAGRYGFNGKERDSDLHSLTAYDYGFRIYNPAIGKFLSVDPLTKEYPWNSSYAFAEGDPINCIDLDGLERVYHYQAFERKGKIQVVLMNSEGDDLLNVSSYTLTYKGKTLSSKQYDNFSLEGQFQISAALSNLKTDWMGKFCFRNSSTLEQFNLNIYKENEDFKATASAILENGRDRTMENFQNFSLAAWGAYGALYSSVNTYSNGKVSTTSSMNKQSITANNANPKASQANTASKRPTPIESEKQLTPTGAGIINQPKFKSGQMIKSNIRGHVKPESYNFSTLTATEVKNFTFTPTGVNQSSINTLVKQITQRQTHLPAGSIQSIIVDIRGQNVPLIQQMYFRSKVLEQTRTPNVTITFQSN